MKLLIECFKSCHYFDHICTLVEDGWELIIVSFPHLRRGECYRVLSASLFNSTWNRFHS